MTPYYDEPRVSKWVTFDDEIEDIEVGERVGLEWAIERIPYSLLSDRVRTMGNVLRRRMREAST